MNLQMMDLAKLKVVELRAELSQRGLDTKGNKPVLVERLRKALEEGTGDGTTEATAPVVSQDEDIGDVPKDVRESTPEPTTPNKTSGRSSRSSVTTTPTKVTPTRGSPKIWLTPLSEKQVPQTKSPVVEKDEKIGVTNEAPPDESKETEKKDDESQLPVETTEHLESLNETSKTDACVTEESEETSQKSPVVDDEAMLEAEENNPEIDDNDKVRESDKDEEFPCTEATEAEETSEEAQELYETNEEQELKGDEQSDSELCKTQEIDEDKLLEDEEMETEDVKQELDESIVEKQEIDSDKDITQPKEEKDVDKPNPEESVEEKPKITIKTEKDEKANDENTLALNEQKDVEMKEIKEETEDDSKSRDRKDRKDRKRKRSSSPQEDRHRSSPTSQTLDEPDLNETDVVLSWYDSDLNLVINKESFLSATAMHNDGFGYIWAGARASFGFTEGKVYFETKITEYCEVNLQDEESPHVMRVGWSVQGTSMQLGEEKLTYGYGGTGKISTGNKFSDYGTPFGKDDVVGCYLDMTSESNVVISYTVNGKDMGTAFTISKTDLDGKALFPHILTKNCTFDCNFGQEKPWCENILEEYVPIGSVDLKSRVPGPSRPEKKEDCEMIMMCGLPAAGKTVWATKYAQDHPEKMYNILGTNNLIEKMKVIGLPRRRNYSGRWEVLIDKCTRCLNKLLDMASTRRRNYILDQTNVYPSAQRRKMRNFYGYQRRAIIVVPTEEEFKIRTAKRTASEGTDVPESAVLEMKANFSVPVVGESFDAVEWIELPEEEAKKLIEKYNKEGKEAGFGQHQANKRPRFESRDNHRDSRDNRQSSRDSRDSRDHRDRRNNYPDRSRNSTWRGGSNSGGWRDRQQRPSGHIRHGGGSSGGGGGGGSGSGGYGSPSGGGWRGRAIVGGPPSSYRPLNDRRVSAHDRRTPAPDRSRAVSSRQGGWGPMNSYQSSQQSSGGWGSSQQSGNWSGQSQQAGNWGGQQTGWGQQQQQQWGNWKGYSQGNYSQASYSQQGYGNGNWGSWNQQYYNQYWGQQQQTGQTSAAGSQAAITTGSTTTGNSTTSTGSTYSSYSPGWQGYTQSYSFPAESSNTNAQQQKKY